MTCVFISWSGEISRELAEVLREWIPSVLQFAKPYFTPNDVEKGAKWGAEISKKLAESNVGIICLTKENVEKPWILFEAGALSKDLDNSKVCSVLFGLENTDISGPLSTFQTTEFRKSDFKKMMQSINDCGDSAKLEQSTFDNVFEMWWPTLEEKVNKILTKERTVGKEIRSDRDLLEEILLLSRSRLRKSASSENETSIPTEYLVDLLKPIEKLVLQNAVTEDKKIQSELSNVLHLLRYLARHCPSPERMENTIIELEHCNDNFLPF
ncbi:TIR domain-containing protein [Celeribacter sp. ULVN23_4]